MPAGSPDSPWGRSRPVFLQHEDFIWFSAACPTDYTLAVIDRSMIIRYVNRVHKTQEIDKVLGSEYLGYIGEADREPVLELLTQVFQKGESVVFDTSALGPENEYVGYRCRIQPLSHGAHVNFALVMAIELARLNNEEPPGETISVCAWTNRVRLGTDWVPLEDYLRRKFGLKISHGISPEAHKLMAEGAGSAQSPAAAAASEKETAEALKSRLRRTARVFLDKAHVRVGQPPKK